PPALRALADADRLQWIARGFVESDVDEAWLVHVAVDDADAAARVSEACAVRRVFCVRADDRHAATAWTPATARLGPVTVGVTAGGDPPAGMGVRHTLQGPPAPVARPPPPRPPPCPPRARAGAGH